jgi:hypothetical protein
LMQKWDKSRNKQQRKLIFVAMCNSSGGTAET